MAKLRHLFRPVNVAEERDFERENIARKADRYLRTNPLERFRQDSAWGVKVERIRKGLQLEGGAALKGLILDLGGNTAGEATVLQQQGFNLVVGDINEVALEVSRQRVKKFNLRSPIYVALDAQQLPFADDAFSAVTVIEALHHFPSYARVLAEVHRVLKPGGIFYSQEPNGLDPLRRLSEIRDRLRGTIEKSFFIPQLSSLCRNAGFDRTQIRALPTGRSSWKLQEVPAYRQPVYRLHGFLQTKLPRLFGPLEIRARKPGSLTDAPVCLETWSELLRSPISGSPLRFDPATNRWVELAGGHSFPDLNGIPVLIRADGTPPPRPHSST